MVESINSTVENFQLNLVLNPGYHGFVLKPEGQIRKYSEAYDLSFRRNLVETIDFSFLIGNLRQMPQDPMPDRQDSLMTGCNY